MLFISNKYTRTYYMIVNRAKSRTVSGYTESHHIIPKSLGGSNDKDNLVTLTAKEHFICHMLLIRMTEGEAKTKMRYAAYMFTKRGRSSGREKITGKRYEYLKEQLAIANKERPGPNRGRKLSDEWKANLSKARKGRKLGPQSAEHRAKLGKWKRTDAHRKAISEARKAQAGKQKRTDETKEKMSAWQRGVPKPKVACKHCGKETSLMNHKRWHGDNCKLKN